MAEAAKKKPTEALPDEKTKKPGAKADPESPDAADENTPLARKRLPGKKLVLFIALPLALILGALAGAWQFGLFAALIGDRTGKTEVAKDMVFYDLPEMLVNLQTSGRQASYLKLKVALELENAELVRQVERALPRVIDSFQVYLRELRSEELTGSAGTYRLKEELLLRLNTALYPAKVSDVLFKEMLVQ
jgi:flagellar FliL protein